MGQGNASPDMMRRVRSNLPVATAGNLSSTVCASLPASAACALPLVDASGHHSGMLAERDIKR